MQPACRLAQAAQGLRIMNSGALNSPTVLIADCQPDTLESLRFLLKGEGCSTQTACSPQDALKALELVDFDLILMDVGFATDTCVEGGLLRRLTSLYPAIPIVVMTAWGSVELALEAMRQGARDFIQKPWESTRLITIVRNQVELGRALRKAQSLENENRALRAALNPGRAQKT